MQKLIDKFCLWDYLFFLNLFCKAIMNIQNNASLQTKAQFRINLLLRQNITWSNFRQLQVTWISVCLINDLFVTFGFTFDFCFETQPLSSRRKRRSKRHDDGDRLPFRFETWQLSRGESAGKDQREMAKSCWLFKGKRYHKNKDKSWIHFKTACDALWP